MGSDTWSSDWRLTQDTTVDGCSSVRSPSICHGRTFLRLYARAFGRMRRAPILVSRKTSFENSFEH